MADLADISYVAVFTGAAGGALAGAVFEFARKFNLYGGGGDEPKFIKSAVISAVVCAAIVGAGDLGLKSLTADAVDNNHAALKTCLEMAADSGKAVICTPLPAQ